MAGAVSRGRVAPQDGFRGPATWAYAVAVMAMLMQLAGCRKPPPKYNYAAEPDPRRGEFVLGPSDALRITVWRNPDLSTDAIVRPDGTITMPLVGDIRAGGRTPLKVRAEIRRRLQAYVKEGAVVTVAVVRVSSYRFTVAGKVNRAGMFTAPHYVTVVEAIAMAGGPTRFANAARTRLIRRGKKGRVRRIPINYPAIAAGRSRKQNLVVVAGDTIFVP